MFPHLRKHALAAVALSCVPLARAQQDPLPPARFAPPNLSAKGVEALAMDCAICHGPAGRPKGTIVAALAGRPEAELARAMLEFKEGTRAATVMHQVAKGYSDAEIAALARYFSLERR